MLQSPVLVLNATYEPVNVCGARRAIVLVLKGAALTEEISHQQIRANRLSLPVPSVIRLLEYRRIPYQSRVLSRKNILMRDRYTCQYCAETLTANALTLDHVLPRARGGKSSWENLVACCYRCNNVKGDRTPEQAGMRLLKQPRPFNLHTNRHLMRLMAHSDSRWRKYLYF
jgi:5-methylcytosine-specific restriction endonuclease McrA